MEKTEMLRQIAAHYHLERNIDIHEGGHEKEDRRGEQGRERLYFREKFGNTEIMFIFVAGNMFYFLCVSRNVIFVGGPPWPPFHFNGEGADKKTTKL